MKRNERRYWRPLLAVVFLGVPWFALNTIVDRQRDSLERKPAVKNRHMPLMRQLISDSIDGKCLRESSTFRVLDPGEIDKDSVLGFVKAHQDYASYHLLFVCKRFFPCDYLRVPKTARASILCSSLEHLTFLNDWGYLSPSGSFDGEAADALLEIGDVAIRYLLPILGNKGEAFLYGSEEATLSGVYEFRRCDFAFRYISMLKGRVPRFPKSIHERDHAIEILQRTGDRAN
jgi:hypothetical protein